MPEFLISPSITPLPAGRVMFTGVGGLQSVSTKLTYDDSGIGLLGVASIVGGSGSAGTLDLFSTSHATKGKIRLGGSASFFFDQAASLVSLGTSAPAASRLDIVHLAGVSGPLARFYLSQTTVQTTDTLDVALRIHSEIQTASASNQSHLRGSYLVSRNVLTGGGAITNLYGAQIEVQTAAGTITGTAIGLFVNGNSLADGSVTQAYGAFVGPLQGTSQAGLCVSSVLAAATNKALLLLGTSTIPAGHVGAQITLGTITQNTPFLNTSATWNASDVDMTADASAITDTASGINSSLIDRKVGGVSKFRVNKYGDVFANSFTNLAATATYRTRYWQAQQNAAATTISMMGFATAPTTTGTASVINNVNDGEFINYNSAATTDADAGWKWTAETTRFRWSTSLTVKLLTPATITSKRVWVGLFSADPMASNFLTSGVISGAGFRFSGDTWRVTTSNGTVETSTDTGITYEASTAYVLTVDASNNFSSVKFFINGVCVAVHTASLPASTTPMMPYAQVRTLTNAARDIMLSTVKQESE